MPRYESHLYLELRHDILISFMSSTYLAVSFGLYDFCVGEVRVYSLSRHGTLVDDNDELDGLSPCLLLLVIYTTSWNQVLESDRSNSYLGPESHIWLDNDKCECDSPVVFGQPAAAGCVLQDARLALTLIVKTCGRRRVLCLPILLTLLMAKRLENMTSSSRLKHTIILTFVVVFI